MVRSGIERKFNNIRVKTACVVLLLMVCSSLAACGTDNDIKKEPVRETELALTAESENDSYGTILDESEIMEDLSCPEKGKVEADRIQPKETALAVRYVNGAWGYQEMLLIIDKEGNCKYQDLSTYKNGVKEIEDLLSYMDDCLADGNIPYEELRLELPEGILETVVSAQDFELEPTDRIQYDAGEIKCYAVCGSGSDRELVCMQQDGDIETRSRFRNVRKLCEEMLDLYNRLLNIKF